MKLDNLPRAVSGPGRKIYKELFGPLLRESFQYDRVSSFYRANSLYSILQDVCEVWKRGGNVRLILGHSESEHIVPSLQLKKVAEDTKTAVSRALEGYAEELSLHHASNPFCRFVFGRWRKI